MICQICGLKSAEEVHHKFSQTKRNKRLYGELIHHELNLEYLCKQCHIDRPTKWTEYEFRTMLINEKLPELKKPVGRCRRNIDSVCEEYYPESTEDE